MTSVVIPAHNEATVIERCLSSVLGQRIRDLRVIVVCNGCEDDTAAVVRSIESPAIEVIEIAEASKTAALNAGDVVGGMDFPRIYLDADVVLGPGALAAVEARLIAEDSLAAAPALRVNQDGLSWLIRRYYRFFVKQPWVTDGLIGSGFIGLSAKGRAKFGTFPQILNDDKFVFNHFRYRERATVDGWFEIWPPRTLASLVRAKARVRTGEQQLQSVVPVTEDEAYGVIESGGLRRALLIKLRDPVGAAAWYVISALVSLECVRARRAGSSLAWRQDRTSRYPS